MDTFWNLHIIWSCSYLAVKKTCFIYAHPPVRLGLRCTVKRFSTSYKNIYYKWLGRKSSKLMKFNKILLCRLTSGVCIIIYFNQLKGTVSRDFWQFFGELKRFDLGPKWTGKNGFANFFVFCENIRLQR